MSPIPESEATAMLVVMMVTRLELLQRASIIAHRAIFWCSVTDSFAAPTSSITSTSTLECSPTGSPSLMPKENLFSRLGVEV